MSISNIAVYAGGPLGPTEISQNLSATQQAGWTTIILSLFHIGRPDIGQIYGDIIFNGSPMVVTEGKYVADSSWPGYVAQLKQQSHVTQIYASVGGGSPVQDFTTIQTIYHDNNNSFDGTWLMKNFQVLRDTFPAIDGIDMDCEDNYDQPSFVAFCEMLIGMGFAITFCPYTDLPSNVNPNLGFWEASLAAIEENNSGAVKWWNLQGYDGGSGNDPQTWANYITNAIPKFSTDGYIVCGDWTNDSPSQVTSLLSQYSGEACLGGGFIWNMDGILDGSYSMKDYVQAIKSA